MSEGGSKGSRPRADTELRKASLLLSGLLLTPDEGLQSFQERRGADPKLPVEHVKRAREILYAVYLALSSKDAERWARVERAWDAVQEAEGGPREESSEPPPVTASPAAADAATPAPEREDTEERATDARRESAAEPLDADDPDQTIDRAPGERSQALPFEPRAAASAEAYADVCAELAVDPDRSASVLVRHGFSGEEHYRRVSEMWAQRMEADDALRREWIAMCVAKRDRLLRKP